VARSRIGRMALQNRLGTFVFSTHKAGATSLSSWKAAAAAAAADNGCFPADRRQADNRRRVVPSLQYSDASVMQLAMLYAKCFVSALWRLLQSQKSSVFTRTTPSPNRSTHSGRCTDGQTVDVGQRRPQQWAEEEAATAIVQIQPWQYSDSKSVCFYLT